jgi:hypothetical protein
MGTHAKLIL